jgi:hypothetical protein
MIVPRSFLRYPESGDKVVVHGDPRVHAVAWSNFRWDFHCGQIVENWQPDHLQVVPDDAPVTCVTCLAVILRHP